MLLNVIHPYQLILKQAHKRARIAKVATAPALPLCVLRIHPEAPDLALLLTLRAVVARAPCLPIINHDVELHNHPRYSCFKG